MFQILMLVLFSWSEVLKVEIKKTETSLLYMEDPLTYKKTSQLFEFLKIQWKKTHFQISWSDCSLLGHTE